MPNAKVILIHFLFHVIHNIKNYVLIPHSLFAVVLYGLSGGSSKQNPTLYLSVRIDADSKAFVVADYKRLKGFQGEGKDKTPIVDQTTYEFEVPIVKSSIEI